MKQIHTKAVVVGAGAGGFAAAYTLAKNKIKTILIEKNPGPGGTSVFGGINCWEPGVASGELHQIIKNKLSKIPNACAVCKTVDNSLLLNPNSEPVSDFSKYPYGLSVTDSSASYEQTLKRCLSLTNGVHTSWRRFQFEPVAMSNVMLEILKEYDEYLELMFETEYISCKIDGNQVKEITVKNKDGEFVIAADYFVDSTGDIVLARDTGCEVSIGTEDKSLYNEPSAGVKDENCINGVSYVFRIRKSENTEHIDKYTPNDKAISRMFISCFNMYPNGDINVNMLPTLNGREYLELGKNADEVGIATVKKYWHTLQTEYGMKGWELVHIFPMAGVRESYRLVGKYVLTENDIDLGVENQVYDVDIATIADHMLDKHGEGGGGREAKTPYAIPISCLESKEYSNLFVACRGASFSNVAASSARLTRTILGLGEAVGKEISKLINNQN